MKNVLSVFYSKMSLLYCICIISCTTVETNFREKYCYVSFSTESKIVWCFANCDNSKSKKYSCFRYVFTIYSCLRYVLTSGSIRTNFVPIGFTSNFDFAIFPVNFANIFFLQFRNKISIQIFVTIFSIQELISLFIYKKPLEKSWWVVVPHT